MSFSHILIKWYKLHKRHLPWRNTNNPYFIWLSEIILQQTQVKQGLPYYLSFIKKYPSVKHLAQATETDVLKLWQGLGYYSRARNLHATAKHIAFTKNGVFPNNYKDLIKLKGIGDYTASAIASICFNEPTAVVDGNVYRVLSRFYGIKTPVNSSKGKKLFKNLASKLIDKNTPALFNQSIMEFGSQQCTPKNTHCRVCPLQNACVAFNTNSVNKYPVKTKKPKVVKKHINFLVCIDRNANTWLEKRKEKGIWQHLYQFPLVESNKSLKAHEFETLNIEQTVLNNLNFNYTLFNANDKIHKLTHQHLYTKFWIIELADLPKGAIKFSEILNYPVPVLVSKFIAEFNPRAFLKS